jgi:hypothetical protein
VTEFSAPTRSALTPGRSGQAPDRAHDAAGYRAGRPAPAAFDSPVAAPLPSAGTAAPPALRAAGRPRRELLDRTLIINHRHAAAVLAEYTHHYNSHRPHRTLGQAAPLRPLPQPTTSEANTVQRRDRLGGLLHEYQQVA